MYYHCVRRLAAKRRVIDACFIRDGRKCAARTADYSSAKVVIWQAAPWRPTVNGRTNFEEFNVLWDEAQGLTFGENPQTGPV